MAHPDNVSDFARELAAAYSKFQDLADSCDGSIGWYDMAEFYKGSRPDIVAFATKLADDPNLNWCDLRDEFEEITGDLGDGTEPEFIQYCIDRHSTDS